MTSTKIIVAQKTPTGWQIKNFTKDLISYGFMDCAFNKFTPFAKLKRELIEINPGYKVFNVSVGA